MDRISLSMELPGFEPNRVCEFFCRFVLQVNYEKLLIVFNYVFLFFHLCYRSFFINNAIFLETYNSFLFLILLVVTSTFIIENTVYN